MLPRVSIELLDGGQYVGEVTGDNIFEGKGEIVLANGDFYNGLFKNGKFVAGQGRSTYDHGDYTEGEYEETRFISGKQRLTFLSGDCLEGDFTKGKFTGKCKMTRINGDYQDGEFLDSAFVSGKTRITYASGDRYEGEYREGLRTGSGTMTRVNGDYEVGKYLNDRFVSGKQVFHDGDYSEGTFCEGVLTFGKMKSTDEDGDIYEGYIVNGKPHGEGKLVYLNGDYSEGTFCEGVLIFGKMKSTDEDGDIYEGDIVDGKPHGKGTFVCANGDSYEGEFQNGVKHGKGTFIGADGNFYTGDFVDGLQHGQGCLNFVVEEGEKRRHEGGYANGLKNGRGRYTFEDGSSYELDFINDLPVPDLSNLGDSFFLGLLTQKAGAGNTAYSLGIMKDWLQSSGFGQAAVRLNEAYRHLFACTKEDSKAASIAEILQTLQEINKPVLLAVNCTNHTVGLQLIQSEPGFIDLEVYNTGGGLDEHHEQNEGDEDKFQTVRITRTPIANLTQEVLLRLIDEPDDYDAFYREIDAIPGGQSVRPVPIVWQRMQKANNCSLMWIFAYLRNTMPIEDYAGMRFKLFTDCLAAAKAAGRQNRIPDLERKIEKLKQKYARYLVPGPNKA